MKIITRIATGIMLLISLFWIYEWVVPKKDLVEVFVGNPLTASIIDVAIDIIVVICAIIFVLSLIRSKKD